MAPYLLPLSHLGPLLLSPGSGGCYRRPLPIDTGPGKVVTLTMPQIPLLSFLLVWAL